MLETARSRRKTLKKRKRKTKNEKMSNNSEELIYVLHALFVFSYIYFLKSPQAAEWRLKRYHFCDTCCSWTSSADELFLEQKASATICSWTVRHVTALTVLHYMMPCRNWWYQRQVPLPYLTPAMSSSLNVDIWTNLLRNGSKSVNDNHVAIVKPSYSKSKIKLWSDMPC